MMCANTDSAPARRRAVARAALLVFLLGTGIGAARAADMPGSDPLRGTLVVEPPVRWDGFLVGATLGYTLLHSDFSSATRQMVHDILRESTLESEASPSSWDILGSKNSTSSSFGGFVGYNWQMDSIVLGIDGAYNKVNGAKTFAGPSSLQRVVATSDGTGNNVFIKASSMLEFHDYATLRGRVGWAAGQFLPYAFAGGAVGRFDYATQVRVRVAQSAGGSISVYAPPAERDAKDNAIAPGFVTGLGVDVALLPNVVLRAEWEFAMFAPLNGIRATTNTARAGLALHF